jgi:hypothetical protein
MAVWATTGEHILGLPLAWLQTFANLRFTHNTYTVYPLNELCTGSGLEGNGSGVLRYYPTIHLEGLKKVAKNIIQDNLHNVLLLI